MTLVVRQGVSLYIRYVEYLPGTRKGDKMSEHFKRLKRELKFKGAIIDFYQDTMEIDGNHTATWDFINHKGAAAVVPVTKEGKF